MIDRPCARQNLSHDKRGNESRQDRANTCLLPKQEVQIHTTAKKVGDGLSFHERAGDTRGTPTQKTSTSKCSTISRCLRHTRPRHVRWHAAPPPFLSMFPPCDREKSLGGECCPAISIPPERTTKRMHLPRGASSSMNLSADVTMTLVHFRVN